MKLSYYLPTGTTQEFYGYSDPAAAFDKIVELAAVADGSGFDTIWVPDHFMPFGPAGAYVFEAWTTLAALARETSSIKLGQLVNGNGYRNPALLAKMASTLDVITRPAHARHRRGVVRRRIQGVRIRIPAAATRLKQLEEALQIIESSWTNPETTFDGVHFRTAGFSTLPRGVQSPHIPIMIAGGGEKVTLRLVAQYGDPCNVQEPPDEVARKYGILADHCTSAGRDFSAITKTSTSYCIIADTDEQARAAVPPGHHSSFPATSPTTA